MKYTRKELLYYLNKKHINYIEYSHKPLFSVNDSKELRGDIKGSHTKNLFLKDKKKNFFLISCLEDKKIDLKKIKNMINVKNLSFASEISLKEILEITPGAVTPFALINDKDRITDFFLDKDILKSETVNFHPLVNNFTLNMPITGFINFLESINIQINLINFRLYKIEKFDGTNN